LSEEEQLSLAFQISLDDAGGARLNCAMDALAAAFARCATFTVRSDDGAGPVPRSLQCFARAVIAQRCGDGVGAAAAVDDLRVALGDVDALRGPLGGDAFRDIVRDLADPQKIVDIQEVIDLLCDIGLATPGPYGKPWREICVVWSASCRKCALSKRRKPPVRRLPGHVRVSELLALLAAKNCHATCSAFRNAGSFMAAPELKCDRCRLPPPSLWYDLDFKLKACPLLSVLRLTYDGNRSGIIRDAEEIRRVMGMVWRGGAPINAKSLYSSRPRSGGESLGKGKKHLVAVVVYEKGLHFAAFVRARDGSDSWTQHDGRVATDFGSFAAVTERCVEREWLPYVLFYDKLLFS